MKDQRMRIGVMAAAMVVTAAAFGQAQSMPAASQPAAPRWQATLEKLASADFAVRRAGQLELEKATWRDRDALYSLANRVTDEEVKERVAMRVEALDEQLALDPPPLSLEMKDAPLPEVAAALSRALQMPLEGGAGSTRKYTLHAVDMSFADVFLALNGQGGFLPDFAGRRLQATARVVRGGVKSGPFLICPMDVTPSADDAGGADAGNAASRTMTLSYVIVADPRMRILNSTVPLITSVIDDQGNELIPPPLPNQPPPDRIMVGNVRGSWEYPYSVDVEVPAGVKKIVSVKGDGLYTVEAAKISVEVADVEKQGHTSIVVGDREVVYETFSLGTGGAGGTLRFNGRVLQQAAPAEAGPNVPTDRAVTIKLIDAAGRVVRMDHIAGSYGGTVSGDITGPIRGIFSVPIKTADLAVPFEMKNIAVPGAEPSTRP